MNVAEFSFGSLIVEARKRASVRSRTPYIVRSKVCTCEVEISYFSQNSTREHYSRCADHIA